MTLDSTGKHVYTTVVAPAEVDIASSNTLREDIEEAVRATGWVIVDLSVVEFIDSTGLSALLAGHQLAEQYGGKLAVVAPNERTSRLFEITQLDQLLEVYPTVDEVPDP